MFTITTLLFKAIGNDSAENGNAAQNAQNQIFLAMIQQIALTALTQLNGILNEFKNKCSSTQDSLSPEDLMKTLLSLNFQIGIQERIMVAGYKRVIMGIKSIAMEMNKKEDKKDIINSLINQLQFILNDINLFFSVIKSFSNAENISIISQVFEENKNIVSVNESIDKIVKILIEKFDIKDSTDLEFVNAFIEITLSYFIIFKNVNAAKKITEEAFTIKDLDPEVLKAVKSGLSMLFEDSTYKQDSEKSKVEEVSKNNNTTKSVPTKTPTPTPTPTPTEKTPVENKQDKAKETAKETAKKVEAPKGKKR
jgi:hypothetical protein